jgi:peptidoglycan-N-acetylglucosamine deacetylase
MSPSEKKIYLTFDDGPTPEVTEFVLETLKRFNAKATFFCIGKNIDKHPGIFQKIISEGHAVGNHTYNHLNGWKTKTKNYLENISQCNSVCKTTLFRPPYGKLKFSQYSNLKSQYSIIFWDVLSGDFDSTISAEKCLDNVLKNVRNGSVVVMHDSIKAFEKVKFVLPEVLENLKQKDFEFERIGVF